MTALLALCTAVLVGGADFLGGLASRTVSALRVAALSQMIGLPLAFLLAIVVPAERVSSSDAGWALGAGVVIAFGLVAFYTAMGQGLISVVAPVGAVTGAAVPVLYALVRGERPGPAAAVGIAIALAAVVVVSIAPDEPGHEHLAITPHVVGLSILSGLCFGFFLIAFSRISEDAGLWPIALERTTATLTVIAMAVALTRGQGRTPSRVGRIVVVIALLDVTASVPLLLAVQRGPIAVASVLASLFPAITVLLAAVVLRERVGRLQLAGVCLALVAVLLVSSG